MQQPELLKTHLSQIITIEQPNNYNVVLYSICFEGEKFLEVQLFAYKTSRPHSWLYWPPMLMADNQGGLARCPPLEVVLRVQLGQIQFVDTYVVELRDQGLLLLPVSSPYFPSVKWK